MIMTRPKYLKHLGVIAVNDFDLRILQYIPKFSMLSD